MSGFKEYDQYDGLGLAELVKKGDVSAPELVEEAILRIEKRNPELNAVIHKMYDLGRAAASGPIPEGPFAGVPFLLKDLNQAYAGVPMTSGSRAFKNYRPDHDSELVRRFKQAGLITLGKTNTPEFGLTAYTEPELFGPTRNPLNPAHTSGGSSGGASAAVASGMVPLASGGDGGGSIRIPSSCCGLFGMKPSRGRIPTGPVYGDGWQGAVVNHVICRSVRDSAAMLDCTHGMDAGSRTYAPPPGGSFLEASKKPPGKLKIGYSTASPVQHEVHLECIKAVEKTVSLLRNLGHEVEEVTTEVDGMALARSYVTMYYGEVAAAIESSRTVLGRQPRQSDFEAATWTLGLLGKTFSAADLVLALREWDFAARAMARFHEKYDFYLTPTVAAPPIEVGSLKPGAAEMAAIKVINTLNLAGVMKWSGMVEKMAFENLGKTPFTQLANLTGQPAMSVPLHMTADGLPIGVQFVGRYGDEAGLFSLAGQLEGEFQPGSIANSSL